MPLLGSHGVAGKQQAAPTTPPTVVGQGTYNLSVASAPTSTALPVGWAPGDFALWWASNSDNGGVTALPAAPSGFTTIFNGNTGVNNSSFNVAQRFLQLGDTTFNGPDMGNRQGACIIVFRGVKVATPIDNSNNTGLVTTANLTAPNMVPTVPNTLLVDLFTRHAGSVGTISNLNGFSLGVYNNNGGSQLLVQWWATKEVAVAASTPFPAFTFGAGNYDDHVTLALAPA